MNREMFHWDVQVNTEDGQVATERVSSYWSPSHEMTEQAVAETACSQVRRATGLKCVAIKVERAEEALAA